MSSRRWLIAGLAAVAVFLLAGRAIATLYTDHLWYASMGASALWRARTLTTIALRVLSALLGGAFVFANLWVVRQSVISLVLPRRVANLEIGEEVPGRYLMLAVLGLSIVFGALLSIPADNWMAADLIRHGVSFRETDPYAQLDLGFYVYWLPFELSLFYWALFSVLLVTALVVFLYALTPSLRWERGTLHVSTYVRRHLTVLGALLLLTLAWSYRLDAYEVLLGGSGPEGQFTQIDYKVSIPANWGLAVFTMCAALLVLLAGWAGQVRVAFAAATAVLVLSVVLRQVAPTLVRHFAEPGDPVARERPYIATRAGYTRRAFAVERIIASDTALGFASPADAAYGVSIWDPRAIAHAIDRAAAAPDSAMPIGWEGSPNGALALVPERPPAAADAQPTAVPWRVARVLANNADARGGIVRTNASGLAAVDDAAVAPVLVHEGAANALIVADSLGLLPAPSLEEGWSRLAHAWSRQDLGLLVEDLPYPSPRLVLRRGVRERVRALAPFFTQGGTIVPAVLGDTLFWMVDLYSASSSYPLSDAIRRAGADRRYFQLAGIAIINATSGRVTLVADAPLDPYARSWVERFPSLFTAAERVPSALLALRPPAVDGAWAQAVAFARAGTRAEPLPGRQVALDYGADTLLLSDAEVHYIASRDGTRWWTVPVLDRNERVVGVIVATGGAKRETLWRPIADSPLRWTAALAQMRRTADTTLASAREGPVAYGRARPVPIGDAITLVQPVYSARPLQVPTLALVVSLADTTPRVGDTFAAIVGAPLAGVPMDTPPVEFRARVEALYESMREAMRRGDWLAFGAAYDSLGALLGRPPQ